MVSIRRRFVELIPELAKFGVVGVIGSIVDLGGAAYLHGDAHIEALAAKAISIAAATVVTYFGSRFWTFRHRVNQALLREGMLFVGLNVVGLVPTHIGSAGDLTFEAGFLITAVVYLGWHAIARTGRETSLTT